MLETLRSLPGAAALRAILQRAGDAIAVFRGNLSYSRATRLMYACEKATGNYAVIILSVDDILDRLQDEHQIPNDKEVRSCIDQACAWMSDNWEYLYHGELRETTLREAKKIADECDIAWPSDNSQIAA